VFEKLCTEGHDRDIASAISRMTRVNQTPHADMISLLTVEDVKVVIKKFPIKSVPIWRTIFDRFLQPELEHFANKEWIQSLDAYCAIEWTRNFQDVIYDLLVRLPNNLIKQWSEALKEVEIYKVYGHADAAHLCKRAHDHYDRIKIDEKMCRCGFAAKSRQGFALHRKKCEYGMVPSIYAATRIRLALSDPSSMICSGCGKQLKSKPGMTLHQKKCDPSPIYDEIRKVSCSQK
jgi:hypothetical protein